MEIPSQNILLIITFGEQSWIVLTDGTWQPVIDDFMVPDGIVQYTVQANDIMAQQGDVFVHVAHSWLKVPDSVVEKAQQDNNQESNNRPQANTANSDPQNEGSLYFFQNVKRTGDEIIAKSGFDTTGSTAVTNNGHKPAESSDDFALITVEVIESCPTDADDIGHGEIYDIIGTVDDVEDGNSVLVTVTDTEGNSKTFITLVEDSAWKVPDAYLTGLIDGQISVVANTADFAGNPATDTTNFIKDTLAQITISVDTGDDDVINDAEAETVNISGTVTGVEENQTVTLHVTDGITTLSFTTQVNNSSWEVTGADLSSLADGELSYSATVTDQNCNHAQATSIKGKDTQAIITIAVDTNADTSDNVINRIESTQVDISGAVTNVEEGQTVTLSVTDGTTSLTFVSSVINGEWFVKGADLSTLIDGNITYTTTVNDISGNPATATTTTEKDTKALVSLDVDTSIDTVDNVINNVESTQETISGFVDGIENDQLVNIEITDGINTINLETTTTELRASKWLLDEVDVSSLNDGTLLYTVSVTDLAGNLATTSVTKEKDTQAAINITVDTSIDTADNTVNAVESTNERIFGVVDNVENGQLVTLQITDGVNTLTFTAEINSGAWEVNNVDLSSLSDGMLTYTVEVTDIAGNPASASTTTGKDTKAEITTVIESGDDQFLLATEINPVIVSGTVNNIESGQTITVVLSNALGDIKTISTVVNEDLTWTVSSDISSFQDGELIALATVNDIAGNPANASDIAVIDTSDGIAIFVNSFEDTFDQVINAVEANSVNVSGLARNVEDGQIITLTITDGVDLLTFTTPVDGLTWSIPDIDLSSLAEGALTFTSEVTDLAGNTTSATAVKVKDTIADITITVDTDKDTPDDVINAAEQSQVNLSGIVTNVEDGQSVTVKVTDGIETLTFSTLVVSSAWEITNNDLSSLADGTLTYSVAVSDIAGNPTTSSTTSNKDTQASITVDIESGDDDFLLLSEITPVIISGTVNNVEPGQLVTVVLSNTSGDTNTITTTINNDLTWTTSLDIANYADGELTVLANVDDLAGNPAQATDIALIDTTDGMSIFVNTFEDTADFVINSAETSHVNISGLVRDVEDGQVITVTVSDGNDILTFTTKVNGLTWSIPDSDLSSLNDGLLTFTSSVTDLAGNETSATKVKEKDTQAEITINVNTNSDTTDTVINAAEQSQVDISGTVSNVEDEQTVNISISDGVNNLAFTTTVVSGIWQINAADLSSLTDGYLTYSAQTNDLAGNTANTSTTLEKDTQAAISISVDTNADTTDNVINAEESVQVTISGTVANVEDGQMVTLHITDGGDTLSFTTAIDASEWLISDVDLSSLADGTLSYSVDVNDIAGNSTSANTSTEKDTQATTSILVDTNADTIDNVINAIESEQVNISGSVSNIEDGQTVTLTITDGTNTLTLSTTVISGIWQVNNVDLSGLNDGSITYSAQIKDVAGNIANASTVIEKDTQADITITVDTNADTTDNIINAAEETRVDISGTVNNIENGQLVNLEITDGINTLTFQTTVTAGAWQINDVDLSSLTDGTITYTASVNDQTGNFATIRTTTAKDTQANITVEIESGDDNFLVADEISPVTLTGTVSNIEVGEIVTVVLTNTSGDSDTITAVVQNDLTWSASIDISSYNDGDLLAVATVNDVAGNPAQASDIAAIDTTNGIALFVNTFEDTSDFVINSAEAAQVTISGLVRNVEDGNIITLTISDGAIELSFTTPVSGTSWSITDTNLTSLNDGPLTFTATVQDDALNESTTSKVKEKDTQAAITIEVDTNEDITDEVINASESTQIDISGTVTNIENGQTVTVKVTDGIDTLTFTSTVTASTWLVNNADLSSLADGTLTYLVEVNDVAGNPASASTTTLKDTQASITITVDTNGDINGDTNGSSSDEVINAVESTQVDITGTVTNIEDGQLVTLTVTDGVDTLTFTATTSASTWAVNDADLSSLSDGTLTYSVDVNDVAGNPASASTTTVKDTQAEITIVVDTADDTSDSIINAAEESHVNISGTVTNIENGQTVTLVVTDGIDILTFSTAIHLGTWQLSDADLSSLSDGTLTYSVDVNDVAGNPASASTTTIKDTQAHISIVIESGDDNFLTATEITPVTVSGTVTNIEAGQEVSILLSNTNGDTDTITAIVATDLTWSASLDISDYNDGDLLAVARVNDVAENPAHASDIAAIDTTDGIALFINTFEDKTDLVINAAEADSVNISGLVRDIEDGQIITLTVTDGNEILTFTTPVSGNAWTIADTNLTSLNDGSLTFTATVSDLAGNESTATKIKEKDTQAAISISVDTNADTTDSVINEAEVSQVDIFGTVDNIENGQTVAVTVTDGINNLSFFTTVTAGVWVLQNVDLSTLSDGELTYSAETTDLAGNPASATTVLEKDTQASVTISVNTNADIPDEVINDIESTQVDISGSVINIEDGQTVTLNVTDGIDTLTFTSTVNSSAWLINDADLSSLSDGTLTYLVEVNDEAGNPASASTTTLKDTQAIITTLIESGADELLLASEINPITVSGSVTNVEAGQTVSITLSNSSGDIETITTTVANDLTWSASTDLSSFNDGELTALATVYDNVGNLATSTDIATIDTIVSIDIDTGTNGLDVSELRANNINTFEGSTTAEVGQAVILTISDGTTTSTYDGIVDRENHWVVSDIDIRQLDANTSWQISASVSDLAGNSATDDMPIIDIVRTNTFYETFVAIIGLQTNSHILDINDDSLTKDSVIKLSTEQSELDKITSLGQNVTITVAPDGQSLVLYRDSDDKLVMNIKLIADDGIRVTLYEAVDNPDTFSGILNSFVVIEATQIDADGSTETVLLPSKIEVFDSPPLAINDESDVIENEVSFGSLTGNDYTAEGPLKVTAVNIDNTDYLVPDNGNTTLNLTHGDLTINSDGSWSFIAGDSFDHTIPQEFSLTYFIVDDDGSEGSAIATFTIIDGKAGSMSDVKFNITEPDLGSGKTNSYNFDVTAGSDSLLADSISFTTTTLNKLIALDLTSVGEVITYTFLADKSIIVAQAAETEVFTINLTAINNGNNLTATVTFDQLAPLDHIDTNVFTLPLFVTAEDLDGTSIDKGKLSLVISDGNAPDFSGISTVTLDEADLINGTQVATGLLSTIIGSDEITSVTFNQAGAQPTLTSNGETILYSISNDGKTITGYTLDLASPIFEAELTDPYNEATDTIDASYTFTLHQSLDQDITSDIPLSIKITDYDGDTSIDNLLISVIDDESAQLITPALSVSEIPVDFSLSNNTDSGEVTSIAGTDSLVKLDFEIVNDAAVKDTNGNDITQNGAVISWLNLGNGTAQGKLSDGTVVFTVSVPEDYLQPPATNSITFNLYGAIDHLDSQSDSLTLIVPVVLIDQDGTHIVDNMNVQVDDGLNPVIVSPGSADVIDEGLLLNNDKVSTTGTYHIDSGSDKVVRVEIADGYVFNGVTTAGGVEVFLKDTANSNGWYVAKTDDDDKNEVFRIRFNTDNTYEYKQSLALDHEIGNGENQLTLNFDIQAIDADGDKSAVQSLTVDVKDDTPQTTTTETEFVEGDVISLQLLSKEDAGADGAEVSKVTYLGIDYDTGTTITLIDDINGEQYAEIIINADGSTTITSNTFEYPVNVLNDSLTYEVTDTDGDTVSSTLNLTVRDDNGTIITVNHNTDEDTQVRLNIIANPGDLDNGEVVTEIRINIASLNNGTLILEDDSGNVVIIPNDGTDYILSGSLLTISSGLDWIQDGFAIPNGKLYFTPALNTSDAIESQEVNISVSVQIEESNGTQKPLIESTISITTNSVADFPLWDNDNTIDNYNAAFDDSIVEDGGPIALSLKADLFDTDGSELLTFRVENIDDALTLSYTDGSTITVNNGDILTQEQLNSLSATTALNSAGLMTFEIITIATEQDNGDFKEHASKLISINVQAVADTPNLIVKNIHSDEDIAINVNDIILGKLTDLDDSETLSYELTLPTGWVLNGLNGASPTELAGNVWSILASDVIANNIQLIPLEDISSMSGTFTIDVQAIATDTGSDGVPVSGDVAKSEIKTLTVVLKGVIDNPTLEANSNWNFDDSTLTISNAATFTEDSLIPLDFSIVTTDNDNSEVISLTITGFPEDVSLVNIDGTDAELSVVGFESGLPVYSVTALQLQSLYLSPTKDFSGNVLLNINAITTEKDGASGEYLISLDIDINPVVDEDSNSLQTEITGIEDKTVIIDFKTTLLADLDGSEEVTGAIITDFPDEAIFTLDGSGYAFTDTLDLNQLATNLGISLTELLESDRIGLLSPEDATGSYPISIDYSITDFSPLGETDTATISTIINIEVIAEVDGLTHFEIANTSLISSDGSAIDLTGIVGFTDDDIDGSEYLDYIVLLLPSGDNWLVTHPNGALPNGDGQWLIPIDASLTSDSFQEDNKDILAGVRILSSVPTNGPVTVSIYGRVLDETDEDVIHADFDVQFDVNVTSSASAVSTLQTSIVDGIEDQTVNFFGHLNNDIAGDGNDLISFRVLASDLPSGVSLSGAGVQVIHNIDGKTVHEYVFTQAALASLSISSAGEDFAGVLDIPVRIIATDTISGDTFIDDNQSLTLDISPVVDGITLSNDIPMQEDVPESLDLNINFIDNDLLPSLGGSEDILISTDPDQNLTITLLDGGSLIDPTGYFELKAGTADTYHFIGSNKLQMTTALSTLSIQPVEHLAGENIFSLQFSGSITDTAVMIAGEVSVIETFSETIAITVEAVTDSANLSTSYSEGDEDTAIDLSSLTAQLIDQDGSETLYLTIQGVPTGAILAIDSDGLGGSDPVPLPNNGIDGGSFNGNPTYSWTVTTEQLPNLVLIPPLDFNGDIPLTLQAITKDEEPGEYVQTEASFTVGVNPISDGNDVFTPPEDLYNQVENDIITIDLGAVTTSTNGNETIQFTVNLNASSDDSALVNIDSRASIELGESNAKFVSNGSGGYEATLTLDTNEIASFDLHLGNLAWGTFNMSVDISAIDTNIVNGNSVSDTSPIESFNFDVELTPEVDAPTWVSVGDVSTTIPENIPLDLEIALQNPAPDEEGYLLVSGLLDGQSLSHGVQQGNDWLVTLTDVTSLSILGANSGDNFDLVLTPYAELNNETENGAVQTINVDVNDIDSFSSSSSSFFSSGSVSTSTSFDLVFEEAPIITDDNGLVNNILDDMSNQSQGFDS